MKYIYKTGNNFYKIMKQVNGDMKYFGLYPTLKEAKQERDKLMKNNWNQEKKEREYLGMVNPNTPQGKLRQLRKQIQGGGK